MEGIQIGGFGPPLRSGGAPSGLARFIPAEGAKEGEPAGIFQDRGYQSLKARIRRARLPLRDKKIFLRMAAMIFSRIRSPKKRASAVMNLMMMIEKKEDIEAARHGKRGMGGTRYEDGEFDAYAARVEREEESFRGRFRST